MTSSGNTPCLTPNLSPCPTPSLTPSLTPCPTPLLRQKSSVSWTSLEAEFLHAVEFGDASQVKKLLQRHPNLNVDCTDGLGRTPLRLAVKTENKELVEILLNLSSPDNIHEALLQAIDAGCTTIAEIALRHPRYMAMSDKRRQMGDTDGFFKPEHGSQFPSYVTALNLAAQKEQFAIVKLLLQRGEKIDKPHKFDCTCQECINKNIFDQLRMARCRLDAYRGIASEAYISLNYQDPILTAIELAKEMKKQAINELYFKMEYNMLSDQLSHYLVKLLDRVWTHQELDIVLDKIGEPWENKYESMARLQVAIDFEEKKFVAHPNCQQRVMQRWRRGTRKFSEAKWSEKLVILLLSILVFPLAVLVFLVRPHSKFANLLRIPIVKFVSHTISFFIFLALIIYSSTEMMTQISSSHTLRTDYSSIYMTYKKFLNETGRFGCGHDFPVRTFWPTNTEIMITFWVIGLIVQECQELWTAGQDTFLHDNYNLMDFLLLSVYTATFTIRYWVMYKLHCAVDFFGSDIDFGKYPDLTESHIYWLNADRRFWRKTDPINLVEGLFAMANILSFTRISYLLPAIETLGPLQISLGRMAKDIVHFIALAVMAIIAFMVALRNLFWYYAHRHEIELNPNRIEDPTAVKYYGSTLDTFRTVFWAIYGRGRVKAVSLGGYNNTLTEGVGQGIDSMYHMTMIILFLNIIIAMMSRSYEQIVADEDVEWKYARSALYMNYILDRKLLPVPLNVIEVFHGVVVHCISSVKELKCCTIERMTRTFSRRRPALVATKSTRQKINESLETEMTTISSAPKASDSKKAKKCESTNYEEVIHRIVYRYIMDMMRENEDGGYVDELRCAFDTIRSEVFINWREKDENAAIAQEAMRNIASDLSNMADGKDTNELGNLCSLLEWWDVMEGNETGTESVGDNSCFDESLTLSSSLHQDQRGLSSGDSVKDKKHGIHFLQCDDLDNRLANENALGHDLPYMDEDGDEGEENILDDIIGFFVEADVEKYDDKEDKDDGKVSEFSYVDDVEESSIARRRKEMKSKSDKNES